MWLPPSVKSVRHICVAPIYWPAGKKSSALESKTWRWNRGCTNQHPTSSFGESCDGGAKPESYWEDFIGADIMARMPAHIILFRIMISKARRLSDEGQHLENVCLYATRIGAPDGPPCLEIEWKPPPERSSRTKDEHAAALVHLKIYQVHCFSSI